MPLVKMNVWIPEGVFDSVTAVTTGQTSTLVPYLPASVGVVDRIDLARRERAIVEAELIQAARMSTRWTGRKIQVGSPGFQTSPEVRGTNPTQISGGIATNGRPLVQAR